MIEEFNKNSGQMTPPPPQMNQLPRQEDKASGLAITSMILGICSIFFCCFGMNVALGLAAVITGFIENNNIKKGESSEAGKTMAWVGIICGFVAVGIFVIQIIFGLTSFILSLISELQ